MRMQTAAPPAAPQTAAPSLPPQNALSVTPVTGKEVAAEFSDALMKLLAAAVAPADQPATLAAADPQADPQSPVPLSRQGTLAPLLAQRPMPASLAAPREFAPGKSPRQPVSALDDTSACPALVVQSPDQAVPVSVAQPLPDALAVAASRPTHAEPAASPMPRKDVAGVAEGIKPAASPPVVAGSTEPKEMPIVTATPSPGTSPVQPTHASSVELAAQALPMTPEPPARQSSAPTETVVSSSPTPHTASPAAQLAPVLMQIGHAEDGAQRLTVRLNPPELGQVQVRIDRSPEAPARVEIVVEKPETLTLLLRDQPQLQHALDQAGVPAEGRSVTFHIASPEATALRSEPATAPAPGVAAGGPNGDGSHGATPQDGRAQHGSNASSGEETEFTPIALPGWIRGGLDITA
jgi:flagellar hook-length control protein FliK